MTIKKLKLSKIRTIELFALLIVLIILIVVYPQNVIFIIFSIYVLSGIVFYFPGIILKRKKSEKTEEVEENVV
jgi:phosphatidylserine synthase